MISTSRTPPAILPPLLAMLLLGSAATGQPAKADPPDPTETLRRALVAHRGPKPPAAPRTLWFKGTVTQRSEQGDKNEANVEQWFATQDARTTIITRIEVADLSGGTRASIRGFDGKRHFLFIQNQKTVIDGNPTYKKDEDAIRQDLALTRFLIENFLVGNLLRPDNRIEYLALTRGAGMASHKIARTAPDGKTTLFYVNARPGEKPYLNGIEFPATKDRVKLNYCFSDLRDFGPVRLFQRIRIFENDGPRPTTEVWIESLKIGTAKRPEWANVTRR